MSEESPAAHIEDLIRYVATSLVDNPDAIVITTHSEGSVISVTIEAAPDDVGKIIGRAGRTIKSIRTLARASVGAPQLTVEVDVEG
ncbi:MAG: KH domain-containing protein [Actinomycetes bacterium]|jgi:predicted RNA-binding protein YlqC (UPF0109 family)|nr:KH domain-containing protein [Actinomycetes bacterium]